MMPTVAEAFLKEIVRHGCEALFLNPGTDTFPIQEAYARLESAGERVPRLVLCPHESIAATAAQGYYLATGRPQVAFVHVDVGTANASGSLNDAKASRTPLVLCAGLAPTTLDSSIPGARNKFINWMQDVKDQGAIVRNYVKLEQTVIRKEALVPTIDRAFQMVNSDPFGPAYLMFPRELLMEELGDTDRPPTPASPVTLPPISDQMATEIVDDLVAADFPLIITGFLGRDPRTRPHLRELSERLAVPVAEYRGRFNLSLDHPLHLGLNPEEWATRADYILVLDQDVPFVPADLSLPQGAKVVHLDTDPIKETIPLWGFPADLAVRCEALSSLEALSEQAVDRARSFTSEEQERLDRRRDIVQDFHKEMWARWEREAVPTSRLEVPFVSRTLGSLAPDAWVFEEAVTSANPFARHFHPNEDGAYFRNGGTYLGWGLGAAVGAKIASPDRRVISVVGDGSFLFGHPLESLYVSRNFDAPIMIVVLNNERYNSVKLAAEQGYPRGVQAERGFVGVDLPNLPHFGELAEACGAVGHRVEAADELEAALKDGLQAIADGKSAVIDVMVQASHRPM